MIIIPPIHASPIEVTTPAEAAVELCGKSSLVCRLAILEYADYDEQRNAALGAGDHTAAEVAAHIAACRAVHSDYKAQVMAVLNGPGDDAAKMVALEVLNS